MVTITWSGENPEVREMPSAASAASAASAKPSQKPLQDNEFSEADGTDDILPTSLSEEQMPSAATGIPSQMTHAMRAKLRALGYSDQQIANMTPQQAHRILAHPPLQRRPLTKSSARNRHTTAKPSFHVRPAKGDPQRRYED
jgi:hypothetical protein